MLGDGLSMVYSFFDSDAASRSLGTFMILDHIARARRMGLPYVYLGYWVQGSRKMDYKGRFLPQQRLTPDGWKLVERSDRPRPAVTEDWTQAPGLIVAPLTPFTADLKVDDNALRRQIDYVVEDCGATMVVAAGVETQEYTYLSLDERKTLIRRTIEFVDGRVPVMVGISHASFRTAIELAHEAERLGAAAVQLLAPLRPFAGPPTRDDLIAYFEAVARETSLPITLYLNPGPGADVSIPDTIALAQAAARSRSSRKARATSPASPA